MAERDVNEHKWKGVLPAGDGVSPQTHKGMRDNEVGPYENRPKAETPAPKNNPGKDDKDVENWRSANKARQDKERDELFKRHKALSDRLNRGK